MTQEDQKTDSKLASSAGFAWRIVQIIWAVVAIILATSFGALAGWGQHGVTGAIALGFVGLIAGAFVAASPEILLELLSGI